MAGKIFSKCKTPLQQLRIENGLTVAELAELCGKTAGDMSKILNGRRKMSPEIKAKLVDIFDLGYHQICAIEHQMNGSHFQGDLRRRKNVTKTVDNPDVNDILIEDIGIKKAEKDIDEYEPEPDYSKPIWAPENKEYREKVAEDFGFDKEWAERIGTLNQGEQDESLSDLAAKAILNKTKVVELVEEALYGKVELPVYKRVLNIINYYLN